MCIISIKVAILVLMCWTHKTSLSNLKSGIWLFCFQKFLSYLLIHFCKANNLIQQTFSQLIMYSIAPKCNSIFLNNILLKIWAFWHSEIFKCVINHLVFVLKVTLWHWKTKNSQLWNSKSYFMRNGCSYITLPSSKNFYCH